MKRRVKKYVIGIDEVGRGALAGPVVVAAACFPAGMKISNRKLGALKDSKKLSPKLRELWVKHFKSIPEISYKTARVYPRAIEKINISQAANRAASSASERLIKSFLRPQQHPYILEYVRMFRIVLDGGLFIKNQESFNAKTIIRADEKITAVKVASILAKVQRDKYMKKLLKKYPRYGFEVHKGYGTRRHISAIKRYGPSGVHRLTFIKKWHSIKALNPKH
ncbi:MAG: ribonuclease HII [Candidatus Liptonbacteria bacterium]|nr:ribonuclease HII [Candidatus Liptonbacteria bacterium]